MPKLDIKVRQRQCDRMDFVIMSQEVKDGLLFNQGLFNTITRAANGLFQQLSAVRLGDDQSNGRG
ncbi:hypothetical protein BSZ32_13885 [Rubritalea profundi]|uniref:Uncharacterized protein n=1 Tax=Rubritalea profundi TaxID=1658618 RepID=A0A2S7U5L8_9BACT|nr:hypothetical protein BSZ32_13885 [Rubritalea profundi]